VDETLATDGAEEAHVTDAPLIVAPFWSRTVAVSCCVSPTDEKFRVVGVSTTVVATSTRTVTDAVPLAEPEVAVMVAVPSPTAATRPVDETPATDASEDAQETDAPLIFAPFWSVTVGVSCCVSPNDEKLNVVGETVIVVATGGPKVSVGVLVSPPQPAKLRTNSVRRRRAYTWAMPPSPSSRSMA